MEMQILFNVAVGICGLLFGYVLNSVRANLNNLQDADRKLCEKVNQLEVLVAGDYVKRVEVEDGLNRLYEQLIRIESKLDAKADKQ